MTMTMAGMWAGDSTGWSHGWLCADMYISGWRPWTTHHLSIWAVRQQLVNLPIRLLPGYSHQRCRWKRRPTCPLQAQNHQQQLRHLLTLLYPSTRHLALDCQLHQLMPRTDYPHDPTHHSLILMLSMATPTNHLWDFGTGRATFLVTPRWTMSVGFRWTRE